MLPLSLRPQKRCRLKNGLKRNENQRLPLSLRPQKRERRGENSNVTASLQADQFHILGDEPEVPCHRKHVPNEDLPVLRLGHGVEEGRLRPNFGGLVLVCIEAKFCKYICVLQHFSKSTRLSRWHLWKLMKFCRFCNISVTLYNTFAKICWFFTKIADFSNRFFPKRFLSWGLKTLFVSTGGG